jgi:hypothetical protein
MLHDPWSVSDARRELPFDLAEGTGVRLPTCPYAGQVHRVVAHRDDLELSTISVALVC